MKKTIVIYFLCSFYFLVSNFLFLVDAIDIIVVKVSILFLSFDLCYYYYLNVSYFLQYTLQSCSLIEYLSIYLLYWYYLSMIMYVMIVVNYLVSNYVSFIYAYFSFLTITHLIYHLFHHSNHHHLINCVNVVV